jgi:hypothetical protein
MQLRIFRWPERQLHLRTVLYHLPSMYIEHDYLGKNTDELRPRQTRNSAGRVVRALSRCRTATRTPTSDAMPLL